jgi:probable HAF family extracellular repeat protein
MLKAKLYFMGLFRTLFTFFIYCSLGPTCPAGEVNRPAVAPRYEIVDLGPLMAREIDEKPGFNQAGDVAAWQVEDKNKVQAVLLKAGHVTNLADLPVDTNTFAFGLNDVGVAVGAAESRIDLRHSQAFLWHDNSLQYLPTLGGSSAVARAINHEGLIIGNSLTAKKQMHATLWEQGQARDLGTFPKADFSRAFDINERGEIAGEANIVANGKPHAVVWSQGGARDLGLLPGGSFSSALALNGRHQAVGFADSEDGGSRPVLWSANHTIDLGSFGDDPGSALDINDAGQIVGTSAVTEGKMRAFLWEKGKLLDLNRLIAPKSGWTLRVAYRINEKGEILVHGYYEGSTHLCLLIPRDHGSSQAH